MKVSLIALDLDGTLIDRELVIRPRVKRAIAAALKQGVRGCIVTGRMFRAALPFVQELDFCEPAICYQGAAVIDPKTDQVLRDTPLENGIVRELIVGARTDGMHLQLFANDQYYVECENEFSEFYAGFTQVRPVLVESLLETFATADATKAVLIDRPSRVNQYLPDFSAAYAGRAYVTRSYPQFIEVLNRRVDKGEALAFVAQRLGIDLAEVLAVGDSWNDAPLLKAAGFGVAMGSAPPELRAAADAIVADFEGDGVAEALETYVLQ